MIWSRTPIEPLRWWVQKVLPTVYDDSLSFQELLGKVVNKLNEVIDNDNDFVNYVNEQLVNYEMQLENFYNKQEIDEIIAGVTSQLGNKVDKLVELGKTIFYASVNGVQSGIEGTDEYDVGPKVAMYTNRGTLSVGDPITAHDAVSKQYLELNAVEPLNDKADKSELRVVQNDVAALVTTKADKSELDGKRDIVTSGGEERAYTCVGQNQSSTPVWDVLVTGSIVKRDGSGRAQIATPVYGDDIANKNYADTKVSKDTEHSGGTYAYGKQGGIEKMLPADATPTAGVIALWTGDRRLKGEAPLENNDLVNLAYLNSHMPSGAFNVTSLFSGSVTSGNYIVENIPNTYKAYIVRHTAGSSTLIKDDVIYVGNNNSGDHSFTGAYSISAGMSYVGMIQIYVPQDATKRSLFFYQASNLGAGYGVVTITDVWGVAW